MPDVRCRLHTLEITAHDGPTPSGAEDLLLAASVCPSLRVLRYEHVTRSAAGVDWEHYGPLLRPLIGGRRALQSTDGRHVLLEDIL